MNVLPLLLVETAVTTPSTVAFCPICCGASDSGMTVEACANAVIERLPTTSPARVRNRISHNVLGTPDYGHFIINFQSPAIGWIREAILLRPSTETREQQRPVDYAPQTSRLHGGVSLTTFQREPKLQTVPCAGLPAP